PIRTREQQLASAPPSTPWGWDYNNTEYGKLESQVKSIQSMPLQQARTLTQNDLKKLATGVAKLTNDKYQEALGYQQRQQQAQDDLTAAKTTKDVFAVDNFVLDQIAALAAFMPTLDRLNALDKLVQTEQQLLGTTGPASQQNLMCAIG